MKLFSTFFLCFALLSSGCSWLDSGKRATLILGPLYGTRIPLDPSWKVCEDCLNQERAERCENAWTYAEGQEGNLGLIIIRNREVVFERYHQDLDDDGSPQKRHWDGTRTKFVYSATKSLAGLLVGAAVKAEILELDEPVDKYLRQFTAGRRGEDFRRAKSLTIRHLLTLTSGLKSPPRSTKYFSQLKDPINEHKVFNFESYLTDLNMEKEPGEWWNYFSGQLELLSVVLREAIKNSTGQTVKEFAETNLFGPLGFRYSYWNEDGAGNPFFFTGLFTSARELSKLGSVLIWPEDILQTDWLEQSRQSLPSNPAYGLTLWLNRPNPWDYFGNRKNPEPTFPPWPHAPDDTVVMAGFLNNDVWIIESLGMVITRISDKEGEGLRKRDTAEDDEFFEILLGPDKGGKYW